MYSRKINNTRVSIITGKLHETRVDLIYLWTTGLLCEGDDVFVETHKEASSTVFRECQAFLTKYGYTNNGRTEIPVGESVITTAGLIPYVRFIIHSVIPNYRIPSQNNNKATILASGFSKSLVILNEYSNSDFVRKVGIPNIPESIYGDVENKDIKTFLTPLINNINKNELANVKEFIIVCEDEDTCLQYEKAFKDLVLPFYEKILSKLFGA